MSISVAQPLSLKNDKLFLVCCHWENILNWIRKKKKYGHHNRGFLKISFSILVKSTIKHNFLISHLKIMEKRLADNYFTFLFFFNETKRKWRKNTGKPFLYSNINWFCPHGSLEFMTFTTDMRRKKIPAQLNEYHLKYPFSKNT